MRGVRFLLEFAKPDEAMSTWGVKSTIVVFGSARIQEDGSPDHRRWYAAAREFGAIASKRGGAHLSARHERHNVICTKLLGGRTLVHVYAASSPGAEFEHVEPDLEDVYFTVMAGHHRAAAGSFESANSLETAGR